MTIQQIDPADEEQEEPQREHGKRLHSLPFHNSGSPTGIGGSPALFFKRLSVALMNYGIDFAKLPKKTSVDSPPPCFDMVGADYESWLRAASHEHNTMPKIRYDMPGEPNYCADCTASFRGKAIRKGACLFPNARFEVHRDRVLRETETVGMTRSRDVSAAELLSDEREVMLGEMRVPLAAVRGALRGAIAKRGLAIVDRQEWRDLPRRVRSEAIFRQDVTLDRSVEAPQ